MEYKVSIGFTKIVEDSEYNEPHKLDKLLEEYKVEGMEVSYILNLPNGLQIPHYKPTEKL